MGRLEQDYREALDALRFSGAGKERIMTNLMEKQGKMPEKRNGIRPLRTALVAAALCVALVGTALAVHYFGVTIADGDDGIIYLQGGIAYYPYDNLSDQIKTLEGFQETPNGNLLRSRPSWQAAEDFIGVNLMDNPVLDGCPPTHFSHIFDGVSGNYLILAASNLSTVSIYGCYEMEDANIMVESHLFTDRKSDLSEDWDEQFLSYKFHERTQVNRDSYTAPSGLTAQILEYTSPGDTPTCKAAFSLNGIPTVVTVSDSLDARAALFQVLDGFVLE